MANVKLVINIRVMYYINISFRCVTFLFATKDSVGPLRAKLHRKESGCPT